MFDVFISYSRKDYYDDEKKCVLENNVVSKIRRLLDDNGITYWFDDTNIRPGADYGEEITKNIENSKVFLFISTINSNNSKWTKREICVADDKNKFIVPFRYDNSEYAKSVRLRLSDLEDVSYSKWGEDSYGRVLLSINNYLKNIKLNDEIGFLKKQLHLLKNKIEESLDAIKKDKDLYNDFVGKIRQTEKELCSMRHNGNIECEIFECYPDDEELKDELNKLESRVCVLNEVNKSLQSRIDSLEKEKSEYKMLISDKYEETKKTRKLICIRNRMMIFLIVVVTMSLGVNVNCAKEKKTLQSEIECLRKSESDYKEMNNELSEKLWKCENTTDNFKNKTFTVNGVTFEMIAVKGGTFDMGASSEQGDDAMDVEKPVHSVTLGDYYIGKFEVTQELWLAVMENNPSHFKGKKNPVEKVSWNDCNDFIEKLNQLTGANFRLPTEAEWEYAARGGNESKGCKFSGSNNIDDVGWFKDNSCNTTHQVGEKLPNELGIYDMCGNVWEWCADWYGYYSGDSQINPTGQSDGNQHVFRGGSCYLNTKLCRVSSRYYDFPEYKDSDYGFRLAASE